MRARYIIVFILIIGYLAAIGIMLAFFGPGNSSSAKTPTSTATITETIAPTQMPTPSPTPTSTPTPTATASPSPTPTMVYASNCAHDKNEIQIALDAYYADNTAWPTADGLPGDIVWSELVPQYMSEMPLIDSTCDWRVSGNPEGSVCVAHPC
ncbi:MAG: hypothetical protein WC333_06375 [Dehalococcoidia bacterium]|jgi:septal ring-binding cell division protein DamX